MPKQKSKNNQPLVLVLTSMEQSPTFASRLKRNFYVAQLSGELTPEIDSLTNLCGELSKSKNIFVYIVTIDDYFPDTDITDFSNRNREYWGQRGSFEKGNVMIAISTAKRQIRVSTSDISMEFLTDEECSKINKVIIPYFKEGKYFDGLVSGLSEMKKNL